MIITTAGRTNEMIRQYTKNLAKEIQIPYVERNKRSIEALQQQFQKDVLVVGKERLEYHSLTNKDPFFFHPNSAMFRIKRYLKGEEDPFQQVTGLKSGMSFLDCTLGLGSDSIAASFLVGKCGKVIGIEKSETIALLVQYGLQACETDLQPLNDAMRRINVVHEDHLTYLKKLENESFDVVYLDPMFQETIDTSQGLSGIRQFASYDDVHEEVMKEAKRVAKKRVVLKDHFRSKRFQTFELKQMVRKTSKFHYGVWEKK